MMFFAWIVTTTNNNNVLKYEHCVRGSIATFELEPGKREHGKCICVQRAALLAVKYEDKATLVLI